MAPKGNKNSLIMVLIVVAISGFVFLMLLMGKQRYSWYESYSPDDKEPYGTMVLYRLMQGVRSSQPFVMIKDSAFKELPKDPTEKVDNYIYIGQSLHANLDDKRQIFDFVYAGNNAFIFCNELSNLVSDSVLKMKEIPLPNNYELEKTTDSEAEGYDEYNMDNYDQNEWEAYEPAPDENIENWENQPWFKEENAEKYRKFFTIQDTLINMRLESPEAEQLPKYELGMYYHFELIRNRWSFFSDSLMSVEGKPVTILGYFDKEYPNYIKCAYGKGHFYFHSTPLIFTNYHMLNDTAMNYCRVALNEIGDGTIFWDEDNRDYDIKWNTETSELTKPEEGPMEFVLSEPMLKRAWYLLLITGLLYIMFGAKRKQRIIPATENMENTSVEYAEVISQMFMKQSDHTKLVKMKMDLFRAHLRDRFSVKLPTYWYEEDEVLYKQVADRCKVDESLVKAIFEQHRYLSSLSVVETPDMLRFHHTLASFYEQSRKP